jgi:plasmid stabilization system protein ParE
MSRPLVIEPEAEAEIVEIADWYNRRNPAARVAFSRAVDRALDFIRQHPEQYQIVYRQVRRALVDGFPYSLCL